MQDMGRASAVAVLMMIVMLVFMIAYFRTYGRQEDGR
jgi:ABC-type sugar transport system permease subunit